VRAVVQDEAAPRVADIGGVTAVPRSRSRPVMGTEPKAAGGDPRTSPSCCSQRHDRAAEAAVLRHRHLTSYHHRTVEFMAAGQERRRW